MRIVMYLLLLVLLVGCSGAQAPEATPGSMLPGFWTTGQQVKGGEEKAQEGLNLRGLNAGLSNGETLISLDFVVGSAVRGQAEQPFGSTPSYRIEAMEGPSRLMIELDATYWDFEESLPAAVGMYKTAYLGRGKTEDGKMRLYLQFTGKVGFRVQEQRGSILIQVEPENPDQALRYYVSLDYGEDTHAAAGAAQLAPVQCDDDQTMLYMSTPFEQADEADRLMNDINEQLVNADVDLRANVIEFSGNWAPTYKANVSIGDIRHLGAMITTEGHEVAAEPWAVGARFLTWMPEADKGLCAVPVVRTIDDVEQTRDLLWAFGLDGIRDSSAYVAGDFASIERAVFSADGRYLAFIDRQETDRLLYVYDIAAKQLEYLAAQGAGDFTSGFAWGDDGVLYMITGDDALYLMAYDPAAKDTKLRKMSQTPNGAGSMHAAGSILYFDGDADEGDPIFTMPMAGGEKEVFAQGNAFSVSPDGRYLMLTRDEVTQDEDGQTTVQTTLRLLEPKSGVERELSVGIGYRGNTWAQDGSSLSYIATNENDQDYPIALYVCDPETGDFQMRGVIASDSIYPGRTADELILVAYQQLEDVGMVPITYSLRLTK